jgi:hypothetical protein
MKENQFEILKSALSINTKSPLIKEIYDLMMSSNGVFHDGTVLDIEQAVRVYSIRAKISHNKASFAKSIESLLSSLHRTKEKKIIIYGLYFQNYSFSLFFTFNSKELLEVLESREQNSRKINSLTKHFDERGLDTNSYYSFENGVIVDGK